MYKKLESYIKDILGEFGEIPKDRKKTLEDVSGYIKQKLTNDETAKLNFICTHNSRRSQMAQIWASAAAEFYRLKNIQTYSGGMEVTAFHPNAISVLERAGFKVEKTGGGNPKYRLYFSDKSEPFICFSKTFDDAENPKRDFAALMTCSSADENCPFVPGAEYRMAITYQDPKESDGTAAEIETYDERCRQIAAEMFYMMSKVRN